jgi:hypothetical protein
MPRSGKSKASVRRVLIILASRAAAIASAVAGVAGVVQSRAAMPQRRVDSGRLIPARWRVSRGLVTLTTLAVVSPGVAFALQAAPGGGQPSAGRVQPRLAANTNAGCNVPERKGFARCFAVVRTPSPGAIVPDDAGPPTTALGPSDIQSAYNLPADAGGGQTVAIVDAFGDSTAEADLAVFRAQYGLPPCTTANGCFQKVDQTGGTNYPADDPGWGLETSLDLDAVSSACPECNILLVEGSDDSTGNLGAAVDEAVALGAKFVSNSYGVPGEFDGQQDFDPDYTHAGVVVAAATGDSGNVTNWPATNPNVLAVGGTTLTKDTSVSRGWDESAWADGGSGCSEFEPQPDYQSGISTDCPANRAIADISADADPASGLAVYDTLGQGGWLQVGGTSLATPLMTAMYALAGSPQPGTFPVTYPYHDPNQSHDLFDITSGSDGDCGNVLCTAGPGWDGPTGLGTPDGVAALTSGPLGTITGHVTDVSTGKPVAGAIVTASPGNYAARTGSDGSFQFDVQAGAYNLTAQDYGYVTGADNGVQVVADQTVTDNFALTPSPTAVLSGKVTDGPGHGWPLHAKITISGYPGGPVYTDPVTGRYEVTLVQGDYTLTVTPLYPGYQPLTQQVTVGASGASADISVPADLTACTAPGYGWDGTTTSFTGWQAATPRQGWAITGTQEGWRFDNPGNRPPPQTPPSFGTGGDDFFAVADSGITNGLVDTTLTSPVIDVSGLSSPQLAFDSAYYAATTPARESASAQVSVDGGRSWSTVWQQGSANAIGHVSVGLPAAAGKVGVRVRFHYTGMAAWYWAIDNIFIGSHTCVPQHGGLLIGTVTDQATGKPVNGVHVTSSALAQPPAWPAGITVGTEDPAAPAGSYWLFTPAGSQQLAAAATGYTTATTTVNIPDGTITRQDFGLSATGS